MLTVAQITDLHITTDAISAENRRRNEARLRTVLAAIHGLRPRPAAIIASGDLVDIGEPAEYALLAEVLAGVEIPIYLGVGNHDRRAPLLAAFEGPGLSTDRNGFLQYAFEVGDLRFLMCDTVEEGQDGGAFCEARAGWLARELDGAPDRPTVVVLHHPPIASGIRWMDPPPDAPWISRLAGVLAGRDQVRAVLCGHVHRPYHAPFAGQIVSVSPATALQLDLDLTAIDMRRPDGRRILLGEPPGYTLVSWDGAALTTHVCVAGDFPDPIFYDTPFLTD